MKSTLLATLAAIAACRPSSLVSPDSPTPLSMSATPVADAVVAPPVPRATTKIDSSPRGPLPKSNLTLAGRRSWRSALRWPDTCEAAHDATAIADGAAMSFHPLADGTYVVQVDCALGAYQGYAGLYALDDRRGSIRADAIALPSVESPSEAKLAALETEEPWGSFAWSSAGELTIHNRFRGPGDCGTWTRFRFEKGRAVRLACRAKLACDGDGPFDPEKWPACSLTTP
jgi:hypothetical protein